MVAWLSTVVTIIVIISVTAGETDGSMKEVVGEVVVSEMGGGIVEELGGGEDVKTDDGGKVVGSDVGGRVGLDNVYEDV